MTLSELIQNDRPVLIDFYAVDCPPCLVLKKELEKVKKQYPGDLLIVTADRKKHPEVFKAFGIHHLPAMLLMKKGKPLWQDFGLFSSEQIIHRVNQKHQ